MLVVALLVFGAFGLIMIFMSFDFIMSGVAIGNSSSSSGNYTGFTELINATPWLVVMLFIIVLAGLWWHARKPGQRG